MPAVVERVVLGDDGIVHGTRVRTFVDLSTTGPRITTRIAQALQEGSRISDGRLPRQRRRCGRAQRTLAMIVSGPTRPSSTCSRCCRSLAGCSAAETGPARRRW